MWPPLQRKRTRLPLRGNRGRRPWRSGSQWILMMKMGRRQTTLFQPWVQHHPLRGNVPRRPRDKQEQEERHQNSGLHVCCGLRLQLTNENRLPPLPALRPRPLRNLQIRYQDWRPGRPHEVQQLEELVHLRREEFLNHHRHRLRLDCQLWQSGTMQPIPWRKWLQERSRNLLLMLG